MLCLPISIAAQTEANLTIKRNTIYIEAFGQGLYNSLSFDRLLTVDKKVNRSFSGGLTLIPSGGLTVLALPVSYNFIFGQKNHHLELGIGFTPMYLREGKIDASRSFYDENGGLQTESYIGHANNFYSYFTPKIGYRYQQSDGGLFLRVTLTPPVAGFNRLGPTKGGKTTSGFGAYNEVFSSAAFFDSRVFPWAGFSVGWTF